MRIIKSLGRGGFGEVFLVSYKGRQAVLKALHCKKESAATRLHTEARMMASINHPATLKVFEITTYMGMAAIIMEYVEGWDLSELDTIPLRPLLEVLVSVAGAVEAASHHGVVHRDVKPSNVRVGKHAQVKLLDFGIAKGENPEAHTKTGHLVGSLPYIAPERFRGEPCTTASDVFSLGLMLFEGVKGERLLPKSPMACYGLAMSRELYESHLAENLQDMPHNLMGLLTWSLSHEPSERIQIEEMVDALLGLADSVRGKTLKQWINSFSCFI